MRISVIVPVYNEERTIAQVLRALCSTQPSARLAALAGLGRLGIMRTALEHCACETMFPPSHPCGRLRLASALTVAENPLRRAQCLLMDYASSSTGSCEMWRGDSLGLGQCFLRRCLEAETVQLPKIPDSSAQAVKM